MQPPKLKFKNIKLTPAIKGSSNRENIDHFKTLYIYFNYNGNEYCYSSKLKIDPKWWNFETHRLNSLTKKALGEVEYSRYNEIIGERYADFNKRLNDFESAVIDKFEKINLNNENYDVKSVLLDTFNTIVRDKIKDDKRYEVYLLDLMHKLRGDKSFRMNFLEEYATAESTKKNYNSVIKHLIDFLIEYNPNFKITDYDKEFVVNFDLYLKSSTNATAVGSGITYFDKMKKIIRLANYKFNLNMDLNSIQYPKNTIELADFQALEFDEINRLLQLKIGTTYVKETRYNKKPIQTSVNESDLIIRDLFVLGCFTGLRFSDIIDITDNHIFKEGDNIVISKLTKKTKTRVKIPLIKPAISIIAKYDHKFPKLDIGAQMFNIRIKNIVKASGIINEVEYFDGEKTLKDYKYNLISSHTMRRSFASIMYFEMKMQPKQIMKFTGHSSIATFEKYLRISESQDVSVFKDPKWDEIKVE